MTVRRVNLLLPAAPAVLPLAIGGGRRAGEAVRGPADGRCGGAGGPMVAHRWRGRSAAPRDGGSGPVVVRWSRQLAAQVSDGTPLAPDQLPVKPKDVAAPAARAPFQPRFVTVTAAPL